MSTKREHSLEKKVAGLQKYVQELLEQNKKDKISSQLYWKKQLEQMKGPNHKERKDRRERILQSFVLEEVGWVEEFKEAMIKKRLEYKSYSLDELMALQRETSYSTSEE